MRRRRPEGQADPLAGELAEPAFAALVIFRHAVEALTHKYCLPRGRIYELLKAVELLNDPDIHASITNGSCPHPTLLLAASKAQDKGVAATVLRRALDDGWTAGQVAAFARRWLPLGLSRVRPTGRQLLPPLLRAEEGPGCTDVTLDRSSVSRSPAGPLSQLLKLLHALDEGLPLSDMELELREEVFQACDGRVRDHERLFLRQAVNPAAE